MRWPKSKLGIGEVGPLSAGAAPKLFQEMVGLLTQLLRLKSKCAIGEVPQIKVRLKSKCGIGEVGPMPAGAGTDSRAGCASHS